MRTTNFKTSSGDDLGSVLIDKDYLLSIYPNLPYGSKLYGWGENGAGELGDNTTEDRSTPRQEFTSSTNWKQVSTSGGFASCHTGAVKTDGTLWMWGDNGFGQLGDNTTVDRSTPVQEFTSSTNWKQVSCADPYFTLGLKTDGTLWSWGYNSDEGLGERSTPRQVGTATDWKFIFSGDADFIYTPRGAIKNDGTLWMWGDNSSGVLGLNDTTDRPTPVQVGTDNKWKQVDGGKSFMVAVKTDGTLWTWGNGGAGRLGLNDTTNRLTPTQVGTLTNWKTSGAGRSHAAAIKTDGTLWAWGSNGSNVIAPGGGARSTPVQQITSVTNWKYVSGGYNNLKAIKTDGTLWTWGRNYSQFGNNERSGNSSIPVQEFTSSTNWVQVSGGGDGRSTLAIQAPGYID